MEKGSALRSAWFRMIPVTPPCGRPIRTGRDTACLRAGSGGGGLGVLTRSPQDAGGPRSALRRSPWEPGRQSPYDADAQEGLVRFPLKKENEMKTDVVGEGTRPTQRHVRGRRPQGDGAGHVCSRHRHVPVWDSTTTRKCLS